MNRPLLPRPSPIPGETADPQPSQQDRAPPRRARQVSAACKSCQKKKTRCPGQRPTCENCRARAVPCSYDTLPGETRAESLRLKNRRKENDLNTMMELYWYLQARPEEDVARAIAAIKTGAEPSWVMKALNSDESSHDALHGAMDRQNSHQLGADRQKCQISSRGTDSGSGPTDDQHSDPSGNQQGEASGPTRATETSSVGIDTPAVVAEAMLDPALTLNALNAGVEAFFSCTGCIFHIYTHSEAQELLSTIRPCITDAGETWPQIMFRGSAPLHLKVSLCSVCIMAAIGLQYTKDPIPALGIEPSRENHTHQYVNIFYELAKHLLEAAIESNVLEAIKICAAMCVFNIIGHATVALANADMGINFALGLGPSFQYCPTGLSEANWINYKRVTRTLMTLRNWMVATLGYVPGDHPGFRAAIHWLMDEKDMAPNEVIQQQLAKLVEIEGNLLRTIDSFKKISPHVFTSTRRDLAEWYKQLPQWMHINSLVAPSDLAKGTKRTVFLVHLFYLSANILVARLAHDGQSSSLLDYENDELSTAAGDGVLAARKAAQILQLQLDEQTIFQRCWLCEFTSYMSCLMLLHSTAQLLLHGQPQSVWEEELSYAESCLDVLEYCGKADKVALHFAATTRNYYTLLKADAEEDRYLSAVEMTENFDYLFDTPELPAANIKQISEDLLKLIRLPFGEPSNLQVEGTLKAGFGSQLDWNVFTKLPFNNSLSRTTNGMPLLELALSNLRSGQFLGSSQPHGWDSFLNPRNL